MLKLCRDYGVNEIEADFQEHDDMDEIDVFLRERYKE